jgi:TPR repeat protein
MYEYGIGTNRDKETALNWYRKAAEQQLPAAVDKLVSMLEVRKQTELGTVCLDVGQTASIEFDTSAGGLVHPRRISPDPDSELKRHGKPNSIDLSLTFDSKMNSTLLHLQNNFNGTISYDCVIRAPESKFQSTDVLEVPSGVTVHEMWPGKLEQLMVRNFRLANSNTQK